MRMTTPSGSVPQTSVPLCSNSDRSLSLSPPVLQACVFKIASACDRNNSRTYVPSHHYLSLVGHCPPVLCIGKTEQGSQQRNQHLLHVLLGWRRIRVMQISPTLSQYLSKRIVLHDVMHYTTHCTNTAAKHC